MAIISSGLVELPANAKPRITRVACINRMSCSVALMGALHKRIILD